MQQFNTLQLIAIWALPILFAITIHEVAHGWVASKLGDKTALMLGRVTLNPLKHIDPVGTILVPAFLLMLGGFIFGWAKPVPVNWHNLRHPKRDMALVAIAGPFTNFLMALGWAGIAKIGMYLFSLQMPGAIAIIYMGQAGIMINLVLMVLNLLPIPPLDGGRVLSSMLPVKISMVLDRLELYGFLILVLLIAMGVLGKLIGPPIYFLYTMISAVFGL